MKNLIVANIIKANKKYNLDRIKTLVNAQIENSVEVGWSTKDIILIANFDHYFLGVESTKVKLNDSCFTGSKMFAVKWLLSNGNSSDDVIWAHDLDAWQNIEFDCPDIKDVGASTYSRPKFNGGSVFWRKSGRDIAEKIVLTIEEEKAVKEEPVLNRIFKSKEYKKRVTVLNYTYNVGCSGYVPRFERSDKPIRVCHFRPMNRVAWAIHALDRDGAGYISVSKRLENLLRRYYPDLKGRQ